QTIYNNVQHYITDIDNQDTYNANYNADAGNNADTKIFDEPDDLKKQKRKNRARKNASTSITIWSAFWKTLKTPNVDIDKLPLKAKSAYKNDKVEKAWNIYTQILQADH